MWVKKKSKSVCLFHLFIWFVKLWHCLFAPPDGNKAQDFSARGVSLVPRLLINLDSMSDDGIKTRVGRSYTPSHHPLFCLWASINFTTVCPSAGRKVRAAPTSTKEAFNRSENTVTFHFEQIFQRKEKNKPKKKKKNTSGHVKQTIWESVVYHVSFLTPVSQPHVERTQTCGSCKVNSPYILVLLQYGCISVC